MAPKQQTIFSGSIVPFILLGMARWYHSFFFFLTLGNTPFFLAAQNPPTPPLEPAKELLFSAERADPYVDNSSLGGGVLPLLFTTMLQKENIPISIRYHQVGEWKEDFEGKKVIGHFPVVIGQKDQTAHFLKSKIMQASFHIYKIKTNKRAKKITGDTPIPPSTPKKDILCIPERMLKIPGLKEKLEQHSDSYITGLTTNGCKHKLIHEDCDGFIDEELHALSIALQRDAQDLISLSKSEKPFFTAPIYVIFNAAVPNIDQVKAYFDRLLEKARQDGMLENILNRFYEYWKITQ